MITGCKDGWGSQRHERRTQSRTCERKQGRRPCQLFAHRDRGDRLHHRGLPRDVRDLPRLLQRAQRRILRFSQRQHGRLYGCAKSGSRVVHQRGELRHLHHVRVGRVPGHRSFRLDVRCVSRGMEPTGVVPGYLCSNRDAGAGRCEQSQRAGRGNASASVRRRDGGVRRAQVEPPERLLLQHRQARHSRRARGRCAAQHRKSGEASGYEPGELAGYAAWHAADQRGRNRRSRVEGIRRLWGIHPVPGA